MLELHKIEVFQYALHTHQFHKDIHSMLLLSLWVLLFRIQGAGSLLTTSEGRITLQADKFQVAESSKER